MKILKDLVFILTSTAIGTLVGLVTYPRNSTKSACIGAVIGLTAGTVISAFVSNSSDDSINFYGKTSGLYEGTEQNGVI